MPSFKASLLLSIGVVASAVMQNLLPENDGRLPLYIDVRWLRIRDNFVVISAVLSCVSWRPREEPLNWPHMIGRLCWEQSYSNLHAVLVGSQWGMHAGWNAPCSCVDSMARHSDGMSLDVLMLCSITHAIRMNGTMTGYDVVHGTRTCVVLSSRRLGAAQIRASLSFAFKL